MDGRATIPHLTVRERLLLHLQEATRDGQESTSVEVTQPGLADAAGIERRHVRQYVRPMIGEGMLSERLAWVGDKRQRVRAYALTPRGRSEASALRRKVLGWTVAAEGADGIRTTGPLAEFVDGPHRGIRLVRLLQSVATAGFLPAPSSFQNVPRGRASPRAHPKPRGDTGPAGSIEMLGDSPRVRRFTGRSRELDRLTSSGASPRIVVVQGVAGIGKSWLAAEACSRLRGDRNLFWHHMRPWDSLPSVLLHLGEFLAALGRPNLRAVVARGRMERTFEVLDQDLPGTHAFLVFDDAHQASAEAREVFRLLLDATAQAPDVRIVILTRRRLSFYDRRDVTLNRTVCEIRLDGLEASEVLASLADAEGPWTTFPIAHDSLRHPLLLDLCRANRTLPSKARGDVQRFLEESILADLSTTERMTMGLASLYQLPVPADALFLHPGSDPEVLLALRDRELVRAVDEGRYEIHDTIREFFLQRLSPRERRTDASFATRQLERLAADAMASKCFRPCADYLSNAVALSAPGQARALFREALGDAHSRAGDVLALSVDYRTALSETKSPGMRRRLHRKLAFALAEHGALDPALAQVKAGRRVHGSADRTEDGWFSLVLARIANRRDRYWEAEVHARRALSEFRAARSREGRARASLELAYALSVPGTTDARGVPLANRYYEDALRLARSVDDPGLTIRIHLELAGLRGQAYGDEKAVMHHLSAVESIPGAMDDPVIRQQWLGVRAWARMVLLADFSRAEVDARESIRLAQALQDPVAAAEEKITLAGAVRGQGRLDESAALWNETVTEMFRLGFSRDRCLSILLYLAEYRLIRADREGWNELLASVKASGITRPARYPHGAVLEAFDRLIEGDVASVTRLFDLALQSLGTSGSVHGLYTPMMESGIEFWYAVALAAMGRTEEAAAHRERATESDRARHHRSRLVLGPTRERQLLDGLRRLMGGPEPVESPAAREKEGSPR